MATAVARRKPASGQRRKRQAKPGQRRRAARAQRAKSRQTTTQRPLLTATAGAAWAAVLVGATAIGPGAVAAVAVPVGGIAAVSAVRSLNRKKGSRPPFGLPAATALAVGAGVPAVALGGLAAATGAAAVGAVVAAAVFFVLGSQRNPAIAWMSVVAAAVAAGSLVVAADQGANLELTLVAAFCLYDLACWVNGSGRGVGGVSGVLAGWITLGVLAVFVAAVFVPPFSGARPWVMLGLLALLAPGGVYVAERVTRSAGTRLPALRRLDSLVLAGPAWVVCASLLLHR